METKKAIELINHVSWNAFGNYGYDNNREEMIALLKSGEKYKQVVKNIESDFENLHCNIMSENSFNIIKEKHFPKPKTEVWERFIDVDFPNSESVIVKMVATKKPDGSIMISYEPQYNYSDKSEKGGET